MKASTVLAIAIGIIIFVGGYVIVKQNSEIKDLNYQIENNEYKQKFDSVNVVNDRYKQEIQHLQLKYDSLNQMKIAIKFVYSKKYEEIDNSNYVYLINEFDSIFAEAGITQ